MTTSPRHLIAPSVVMLALIASCGVGAETAQSTTVPPTTPPPTTVASTTTAAATTTAIPTTTTAAPTTTTMAMPASPAPVASAYGVLGWYDHDRGQWVTAPGAADLPEVGGAAFDVVTLGSMSTAVATDVGECETTGNASIEFDPVLPGERRVSGSIAVLGVVWDLVPRPVTIGEPPPDRLQEALDHLAGQGIDETDPQFVQYAEADLDGDSGGEGLLVIARGESLAGPGDYSVVMLFAEGASAVVAEYYGVADHPYVLYHVISAVADLDGNGAMEVVFDTSYYEGSGSVAYEYLPEGPELVEVLGGGCGA